MVRARIELVLAIGGVLLLAVQVNPVRTMSMPVTKPSSDTAATPRADVNSPSAGLSSPRADTDVPVVWRDLHPGEWSTAPSTTSVRLCGAALERGAGQSVLVLRFCNAQPTTPQRRYAFGYDDLRVHASLPGGGRIAYDLLNVSPTAAVAARFSEGPLPENDIRIAAVVVRNVTDVAFFMKRDLPFGLPSIEIDGRYAGAQVHDIAVFEPLGAEARAAEAQRVKNAPPWARFDY